MPLMRSGFVAIPPGRLPGAQALGIDPGRNTAYSFQAASGGAAVQMDQ
jgi:hypothetical protein